MKRIFFLVLFTTLSAVMLSSQNKIRLSVGDRDITAALVDNEATRSLMSMLEHAPVTITMSDYGGFEKVGTLPSSLPTSNSQITTQPGDIMLYQGNNLVIFYGSNSWSYTRLGKLDLTDIDEIRSFLGNGNISLTLSLDPHAEVTTLSPDKEEKDIVFDLSGNLVEHRPLPPGIYIINGRKTMSTPLSNR